MSEFTLYLSNRMEKLAEKLAETVCDPLPNALDKEVIIVHSKGMQRWVSLKLAEINGICANIDFPFPNAYVDDCFRKIIPDLPEELSPYKPEVMTWQIMRLFDQFKDHPEFRPIHNYLSGDQSALKQFQLATRLADLFDQYIIFRPDWIKNWNDGEDSHFQALLWRAIVEENSQKTPVIDDRATISDQFVDRLKTLEPSQVSLPQRISLFGITTLPLFHIKVFEEISRFCQVNLFLMNPCQEYWGDIPTNWEIKRISSNYPDMPLEELHIEQGNSLLASMGTLARDFFDLLWAKVYDEAVEYTDPAVNSDSYVTLLNHIQSGILNLSEHSLTLAKPSPDPKIPIRPTDDSIRINSCHSPMREIESLYDYLLGQFKNDDSLTPDQIIVMMPDIETYAPYIQAVFDVPEAPELKIPYSIADRSFKSESNVIRTFLDILSSAGSRSTASEVIEILRSEEVMRHFNITPAEFESITAWVGKTMTRWGRDADHRRKLGLPPNPQNTWKESLDRMFLGFALPIDDLFGGQLPYTEIESSEAIALGKLAEFTSRLFEFSSVLERPEPLNRWCDLLRKLLTTFFTTGPDEEYMAGESARNEFQKINDVVHELETYASEAAFEEKIDISVIRHYLKQVFEKEGSGSGFIAGRVTFCAMLPMRSIPFEIVCLTGMNHDAFPRHSKPVGFDLMAKQPRKGDRSRRNDDRYLFLEALLSARRKLYISYVGQSIKDNRTSPPSVLADELKDHIRSGYEIENGSVDDRIITAHRLQAFNPAYFKSDPNTLMPGLFSFSKHHYEVARGVLQTRKAKPAPFIARPLPYAEAKWRSVHLADLKYFFRNPAKYLLEKRLGLYLQNRNQTIEDKEPFEFDNLETYILKNELVQKQIDGASTAGQFEIVRASGCLPHGRIGKIVYDDLAGLADSFVKRISDYIEKDELPPADINLSFDKKECKLQFADNDECKLQLAFELTGQINRIFPKGRIQYRPATVKPKDHLDFWLDHLALNCTAPQGYPRTGILIGEDKIWEYSAVADSRAILLNMLNIYWKGLTQPLHFFPQASYTFAYKTVCEKKDFKTAKKAALDKWESGYKYPGEYEQSQYFQQCFANHDDPLNDEFENTALELFTPLLQSVKEIKA